MLAQNRWLVRCKQGIVSNEGARVREQRVHRPVQRPRCTMQVDAPNAGAQAVLSEHLEVREKSPPAT